MIFFTPTRILFVAMPFSPWLFVIAVLILIFSVFLYMMAVKIIENDKIFIILIGAFFLIYALGVLIMRHYIHLPPGSADVSTLSSMFGK